MTQIGGIMAGTKRVAIHTQKNESGSMMWLNYLRHAGCLGGATQGKYYYLFLVVYIKVGI